MMTLLGKTFGSRIFADVIGNWVRYIERGFVLRQLGSYVGKHVIDLGSGEGSIGLLIARRQNCVVGLLDLDRSRLRKGLRRSNSVKDSIFLVQADGTRIPFFDESIDIVVSVSSLEHFLSDEAALQDVYSILKKRGRLIMTVDSLMNKHHNVIIQIPPFLLKKGLRSLVDSPSKFWQKTLQDHAKTYRVKRYYTIDKLKRKLENVGFQVLASEYMIGSSLASFLYEICLCLNKIQFSRRNPLFALLFLATPFVLHCERSGFEQGYVLAVVAEKPDLA